MADRPGVLLYFDNLRPFMKRMSSEEKGNLLDAILDYAEYGVVPDCDGVVGIAFDFIRTRIDCDADAYEKKRTKTRYGAYCKWAREKGSEPMLYENWLETQMQTDADALQMHADASHSNATDANITQPSLTQLNPTSTQPNSTSTISVLGNGSSEGGVGGTLSYAQFEPVNAPSSIGDPGDIGELARAAIKSSSQYRPLPDAEFERQRSEQIAKLKDLPSR